MPALFDLLEREAEPPVRAVLGEPGGNSRSFLLLYHWIRYDMPAAILAVGVWWVWSGE